jgi:cyclophilin family peptidyl-prolyl cis-trans isomerase
MTTASFASLVQRGFYDHLTFHRVLADFVIQGGDPLGNGQGGPGYSVVERPPSDTRYTRGVVAMAKTAAERPGTSGSQFFVVTGDDVGLPPEYALVGKVTGSYEAVDKIAAEPVSGPEGQPLSPVVIEKATLDVG